MQLSGQDRGRIVNSQERLPYTAPAIVYEGRIEARAGSLNSNIDGNQDASTGFDPADLFGTDN